MSLIKQIKLEDNLYDIGAKWSNIDKENNIYGPNKIITFEDDKVESLKKCIVNIEPVQAGSGDPSPTNVRVISGWDTVNVWRFAKNYFPQQDVIFDVGMGNITIRFPHVLPAGNYTLSADLTSTYSENCLVHILKSDGTYIEGTGTPGTRVSMSFQSVSENEIIGIRFYIGSNWATSVANSGVWSNIQVETGSTATAYEEPSIFTFSDLPETAYGGTLDVLTGVLTISWKSMPISSVNWAYSTNDQVFYTTHFIDKEAGFTNIIAEAYNTVSVDYVSQIPDNSIRGHRTTYNVYIKDTRYTTEENFLATMGDTKLVYAISTPIIYQLSPQIISTLLGNNNIWADCGGISIELENFYSDIQNEITTNLNENTLLYNKNYSLTTSNHYVTNDKISINSLDHYNNYNLYINGSTLANHHIILQKLDNLAWSANGSDDEPAFIMKGANNKDFKFKFSNKGQNVDVGWDWTAIDGSGAFFRTSDATSTPGGFGFFARKPNTTTPTTADCTELYGYPNGLLYWKKTTGDSNPRFAINATSSNYTLYVNGTTYLKGDTKISANTSTIGCTLQYDDTLNTLNFVFD